LINKLDSSGILTSGIRSHAILFFAIKRARALHHLRAPFRRCKMKRTTPTVHATRFKRSLAKTAITSELLPVPPHNALLVCRSRCVWLDIAFRLVILPATPPCYTEPIHLHHILTSPRHERSPLRSTSGACERAKL
jgi:hypothetical protein